MNPKLTSLFGAKPLFLILLPLFFVLHGFTAQFGLVDLKDAMYLLLVYMVSSFILAFLFWLFYKNFIKASLVAFIIMAVFFFFGNMHDFLKELLPGTFLVKYSFILPFIFLLLVVIIILLK